MLTFRSKRLGLVVLAAIVGLLLRASPVLAAMGPEPLPDPPPAPGDKKPTDSKGTGSKGGGQKASGKDKKSDLDFRDGYRRAYDQIQRGEYAGAIVTLHALGRDEHPDIATAIGFASRKLGRYEEAKVWYEKALAADPKHVRTWQYYGMWHLEQGNRLKAQDHLDTIRLICGGTGCQEFRDLQAALDGKISY